MSRPKPVIVTEKTNKKTYKTTQILETPGIWAVFFNGKPINLRDLDHKSPSLVKYRKTSFANSGSALNLCRKLNIQFNSDKFTVVFLSEPK